MATVTTNFNFPIPQSTDLVKDGATAIAALGTSVDTQFVDLKGGTTGQVLSKASNTDLDYSWVTTDDANAIQNAIVNAKGDIIGASANDVPAITSVGANGEQLVADSSATTGLRYVATPSASNPVLNSAMNVWQRGTSFSLAASTAATYVADRWQTLTNANQAVTISRQATGDTTNLPNIQYNLRWQRNSGQTGTGGMGLVQSMETVNSIPFAGKTVTYSFYARKGADFSGTITAYLFTGTGTDQNRLNAAYTGGVTAINQTFTPTTTWQRFTYTASLGSTVTEFASYFLWEPSGTAGAADYLEITGVQLDIGNVALPYRAAGTTYQQELAACQRYYYRQGGQSSNQILASGFGFNATTTYFFLTPPATMRIEPSVLEYASLANWDGNATSALTNLTIDSSFSSQNTIFLAATMASGGTQYRPQALFTNNTLNGYLAVSAEL